MKRDKKIRIFNQGVENSMAAGLKCDAYYCPICAKPFDHINNLTGEHVPPRSMGGKIIILTCRACNHLSGLRFEHALPKRIHTERQVRGIVGDEEGEFGHVVLQFGEYAINANLSGKGGVKHIAVSEKNDPSALEGMRKALDGFRDQSEFTISTTKGFREEDAQLADLKSAFLVLSAKFGYLFCLDEKRKRLRNASKNGAFEAGLIGYMRSDLPSDVNLAVNEGFSRAVVRIMERTLLLPIDGGLLENLEHADEQLKMTCFYRPFPKSFEGELDRKFGVGAT